ncbi:MAG: 4'-phosphopantetheinyl transferase superfamily protein [Chlorobiaceae bacterium]|nr:4'-phosphopantetheinyl transferase superfamily protein [Chlorobiaceae bacterium]NTV60797.1 4'-phosphopantetheinyl transferase superfamily protein [Chlorobiaceae bacterium]
MMHFPSIECGETHVWTIDLSKFALKGIDHETLLSGDEIVRANRFRIPELRNRFVNSRAALRLLLADYLNSDARAFRFTYGRYGKPSLPGTPELRFNLSHADKMMMAAFALHREVGIDIVRKVDPADKEGIARIVFSATEQIAFSAVPVQGRSEAFLSIWTRKEAYIKATGGSIALHAGSFSVSVHPYEGKGEVIGNGPDKIRLCDIDAPIGFFASLAASGTNWTVMAFTNGEKLIRDR